MLLLAASEGGIKAAIRAATDQLGVALFVTYR
jgi:hypothetical protein